MKKYVAEKYDHWVLFNPEDETYIGTEYRSNKKEGGGGLVYCAVKYPAALKAQDKKAAKNILLAILNSLKMKKQKSKDYYTPVENINPDKYNIMRVFKRVTYMKG